MAKLSIFKHKCYLMSKQSITNVRGLLKNNATSIYPAKTNEVRELSSVGKVKGTIMYLKCHTELEFRNQLQGVRVPWLGYTAIFEPSLICIRHFLTIRLDTYHWVPSLSTNMYL